MKCELSLVKIIFGVSEEQRIYCSKLILRMSNESIARKSYNVDHKYRDTYSM